MWLFGSVIIEGFANDIEIGIEIIENFGKGRILVASEDFASNGHHEGNLHLNLGAVDTVERAIEFGAVEGSVDILVEAGLAGDDATGRSKGGFGFGSAGEISGKLSAGAGNCAGKGIIN